MAKRIYILSLTVFIFIVSMVKVNAQNEDFRKAEKLYQAGDYYSAIAYYSDYIAGKKANVSINNFTGYLSKPNIQKQETIANPKTLATFHLAECYRQINDYVSSESWYDSATKLKGAEQYPSIGYWYGVCLRSNNKLNAAKTAFQTYISKHNDKDAYFNQAIKEIASIEFAIKEAAKKPRRKLIFSKIKDPINGNASNYAPFVMDQNIYFSSTREDTALPSTKTTPYQHHIYYTSFSNASPTKVSFQQDKNIQQGAAVFSADGKTAFFTQWNNIQNVQVGAIYRSSKTDSNWSAPVMLDSAINVKGYSSQQPFFSNDGKYLFFSSNRPGGLGKFDIWVAELNANYETAKVTNLDNTINSREDEKAPYYNAKNETLVFSSNGRIGMGGYDLYQSQKVNGSFNEAVNMGAPVNSIKDDIYFFSKDNTTDLLSEAYISSDRVSTCCLELFVIHRQPAPINHISGTVRDEKSRNYIPNANMQWYFNGKMKSIIANEKGEYDLVVSDTALYNVTVFNTHYYDTNEVVKHNFETITDSLYHKDFYLKKIPDILKDYVVYFDFDKFEINDSSRKTLDTIIKLMASNPTLKIALEGHTDGKGTDEYNMILSEHRTNACLAYLASQKIDSSRLIPSFYGKAKPVAPNTTLEGKDYPEGRQLNRRVKIAVVKE